MTSWTADELVDLNTVNSLLLEAHAPGESASGKVELGVVVVGDAVYVRAYRGPDSAWYQAALAIAVGTIRAGTIDTDVAFDSAVPGQLDSIDESYRTKYGHFGAAAVGLATSSTARAATVRILRGRQ